MATHTQPRLSRVTAHALRIGASRTLLALVCGLSPAAKAQPLELWREVEIIRTEHGVPHVRADNLRAAGYALGWLQCEDYGAVTPDRLWATRGQTARVKAL